MSKLVQKIVLIAAMFISLCSSGNSSNSTTPESNITKVSCPFGMQAGRGGECDCAVTNLPIVKCDKDRKIVSLPFCYCMSYNEHFEMITVGYCVESCYVVVDSPERLDGTKFLYRVLAKSDNLSEVNNELCSFLGMHRTGQMCGSCLEGYAPAIYSYSMDCVSCNSTHTKYNSLKYVAMAYGPLTIFYIIVIMFRISISSGEFNCYILTSQLVTAPAVARFLTKAVLNSSSNTPTTRILTKLFASFYGMFNLDFFRSLYPLFCIHPDMTMIQTLALDYVVVIYPLLLVVGTYIFVSLHGRFSTVVRLWRPFYKCFVKIRKEWDLRVSLVEAFVTFILLSYVKILNTSLDLLTPVLLYNENGTTLGQLYLRVSGTVEYFGRNHLPYAVLAIFMTTTFNIVPLMLLCLYLCLWFQKCLNYFKFHRRTLHAFMEVFHGCFKTHPHNLRHFAAFYLLIRYINLILLSLMNGYWYFPAAGIVMITSALVIVIVQPHRCSVHSKIDAVMLTCIAVAYISSSCGTFALEKSPYYYKYFFNVTAIFTLSIHFLYGAGVMIFILLPQRKLKSVLTRLYEKFRQKTVQLVNANETQQLTLSLTEESDSDLLI